MSEQLLFDDFENDSTRQIPEFPSAIESVVPSEAPVSGRLDVSTLTPEEIAIIDRTDGHAQGNFTIYHARAGVEKATPPRRTARGKRQYR